MKIRLHFIEKCTTQKKKLTNKNSIEIFGRAAWYRIERTFIEMPAKMPFCSGNTRHAMNVANPGIKSVSIPAKIDTKLENQLKIGLKFKKKRQKDLLLLRHIGFTTRTSTMKITLAMIIEASAAFGI